MMVFLYDDAGSPVGFLYRTSEYAKNAYDAYFYEKNFFGDVTAIYNESGSCVARYAYNAWGEHTVSYNSNGIAEMNPIRYRGYYYDTHTGLYYLQSRYYNPAWGRFISMDDPGVLSLSPGGLTDKNLYIYCDNNPVMRVDATGDAWETIFDVVSLAFSVVDVCLNPTDPMAWIGLAGDAIDLIPFVTGVGELTRAARIGDAAMEIADGASDVARAANKTNKVIGAGATAGKQLHRPYIRKSTRQAVEAAAKRAPDGRFLDANTGIPITGKYDLGHAYGHEFWRERNMAMSKGWTQKQFNDYMNNPNFYRIEHPSLNRSHRFEMR